MGNRLSGYGHLVWNILVHHAKTWLPYGVILVCLTGIWFWWDGPASNQNVVIRETKNHQDSPSPSFLQKKTGPSLRNGGTCLYSLAGIRRTKPLADLFEPAAGRQTAGTEEKKDNELEKQNKQDKQDKQTGKGRQTCSHPDPVPQVCGTMEETGRRLILLTNGQKSQACAVGESFGSWQIVYISPGVAGLAKEGVIHEVYF